SRKKRAASNCAPRWLLRSFIERPIATPTRTPCWRRRLRGSHRPNNSPNFPRRKLSSRRRALRFEIVSDMNGVRPGTGRDRAGGHDVICYSQTHANVQEPVDTAHTTSRHGEPPRRGGYPPFLFLIRSTGFRVGRDRGLHSGSRSPS